MNRVSARKLKLRMKSQWKARIFSSRKFRQKFNFPFSFLSSVLIFSGRSLQFPQVSWPKFQRQIFSSKHKVDFLFFDMAPILILSEKNFQTDVFSSPSDWPDSTLLRFDWLRAWALAWKPTWLYDSFPSKTDVTKSLFGISCKYSEIYYYNHPDHAPCGARILGQKRFQSQRIQLGR